MSTTQNKAQETFKVTGDWNDQSKKLQRKFSQLTDADVKLEAGKEEDLLKRIEVRLGKGREEVLSIIKNSQLEKN